MAEYSQLIRQSRLIRDLDYVLTTGDPSYCGTAIEVIDEQGEELFHLVVDEETGETQILFFAHDNNFRLPLSQLKELIGVAESKVRTVVDS